jgi:hypothetical protein
MAGLRSLIGALRDSLLIGFLCDVPTGLLHSFLIGFLRLIPLAPHPDCAASCSTKDQQFSQERRNVEVWPHCGQDNKQTR